MDCIKTTWMIVVFAAAGAGWGVGAETGSAAGQAELAGGRVKIVYNLQTGYADFYWNGQRKIAGFYSEVRAGETVLSSRNYAKRSCRMAGQEMIITCAGEGGPTMRQHFLLGGEDFFLVQVELAGERLSSNWMGVVVMDTVGGVTLGDGGDMRALKVPFDNDKWARYDAMPINSQGTSCEVSAFYDNRSRAGLVVGSVTHDTWKTGIDFAGSGRRLDVLKVYGGLANTDTRDTMPHGTVRGDVLRSPKVMVGFFTDWRRGLEQFAEANVSEVPRLNWGGGVPFGWNSWGKIQKEITYDKAIAVSDFFKDSLQDNHFHNNGTVYINLDSFWDRLRGNRLRDFVSHVHGNGQKAGIYWTPFAYWGGTLDRPVEGASYTYSQIVLRNSRGEVISLDGGMAIDPTHPGSRARMDFHIDRFKELGFDYIKLDFLGHGAIEGGANNGMHYDTAVQTGIEAYNQGMAYLIGRLDGKMFVSLSIAPLFPYQYGHARRVACDTFGSIRDTEYLMNSISYGWWMSGRMYAYNDPDHVVLEGFSACENQSRVTSAILAGTVFLNGDDVSGPESTGRDLCRRWLTNEAVNRIARLGRSFIPVEGNTGQQACDVFLLQDESAAYLAVFNYDGKAGTEKTILLERCGLSSMREYAVTDLWSGKSWKAKGQVTISLAAAESTILRLD